MSRDIVIGSGPAGAAAATALIARGRTVTMLDVGERLESSRAELRARMSRLEPEQWSASDVAMVREPARAAETDLIYPFGSNFPYRDRMRLFGTAAQPSWLGIRPSFAKGGLSNAWGAAVLPYRAEDIDDWPIAAADLAPHYAAVEALMPIAAERDGLANLFPLHRAPLDGSIAASSQATALLARLTDRAEQLVDAGLHFGKARLAVDARCRRCGMCLYGCPYGFIFNATDIVERLRNGGGLQYLPGQSVVRFAEDATGVRVWARDTANEGTVEHRGERLFIAAGVLPTAFLVLGSLDIVDRSVILKDSQHFLLPTLQTWSPGSDATDEPLHTLAQVFLEIVDPDVCRYTVHIQLYTYNDLYPIGIGRRFGRTASVLQPLIRRLSRRLIVAQGFLHSHLSPDMEVRLLRNGDSARLDIRARDNAASEETIRAIMRKLRSVSRSIGLWPLFTLSRRGKIGSSYHCGGTFPMRDEPRGLETDVFGRLAGLRRVFLVDASVLPSIPATTITLPVMANAHRIATKVAAGEV